MHVSLFTSSAMIVVGAIGLLAGILLFVAGVFCCRHIYERRDTTFRAMDVSSRRIQLTVNAPKFKGLTYVWEGHDIDSLIIS